VGKKRRKGGTLTKEGGVDLTNKSGIGLKDSGDDHVKSIAMPYLSLWNHFKWSGSQPGTQRGEKLKNHGGMKGGAKGKKKRSQTNRRIRHTLVPKKKLCYAETLYQQKARTLSSLSRQGDSLTRKVHKVKRKERKFQQSFGRRFATASRV